MLNRVGVDYSTIWRWMREGICRIRNDRSADPIDVDRDEWLLMRVEVLARTRRGLNNELFQW